MNQLHAVLTAVLGLWLAAVLLTTPRNGPTMSETVVQGMLAP